jgi:hypothetical protein
MGRLNNPKVVLPTKGRQPRAAVSRSNRIRQVEGNSRPMSIIGKYEGVGSEGYAPIGPGLSAETKKKPEPR